MDAVTCSFVARIGQQWHVLEIGPDDVENLLSGGGDVVSGAGEFLRYPDRDEPYTYVTMSIRPERSPHVGISFSTPHLRVHASLIGDGRPLLYLCSHEADVSISTTGAGQVTSADLALAREIFNAAARYLADCERLHDEQAADSGAINSDEAGASATGHETAA